MSRNDARDRLIVALDLGPSEALEMAGALQGHVRWLKVGMTLYYAAGPGIVTALREMGFDVFVDLKLYDIPHQVQGAARALSSLGAGMFTVHASGGAEMIAAAAEGAAQGSSDAGVATPIILGVTVLTSMGESELRATGIGRDAAEQVEALATLALANGATGIVCSPLEAGRVREIAGPTPAIVTPGIRPAGADAGDQTRVETPASAFAAGASHLVVGRPITTAPDPVQAAEAIIAEMEGNLS